MNFEVVRVTVIMSSMYAKLVLASDERMLTEETVGLMMSVAIKKKC